MTLRSYLPPALECLQPSDGHNGATYITVVFAGAEVVVFEKVPPKARGPMLGQYKKAQGEMDWVDIGQMVKVGSTSTGSFQSQELGWRWDINMSKRLSHKEPFKSLKGRHLSCQGYKIIYLRTGCNQELWALKEGGAHTAYHC